ncbi:hypothetical protein D3C85_1620580 [compost metagenome]
MLDYQLVAVQIGRYAEPVDAIIGRHRLVVFPALGVGGFLDIEETQLAQLVGGTLQPEVKPLGKIGGIIFADAKLNVFKVIERDNLDTAGVEIAADFHAAVCPSVTGSRLL